MWNKFNNNDKAFTGLEAAIVLIAFVVVAAVFSYVMLGAGFYTTQKSQEVVHTGVQQASSSVELTGDIIAAGHTNNDTLKSSTFFLQLTAGGSAVDLNKTLIVLSAPDTAPDELTLDNGGFTIVAEHNNETAENEQLEKFEKAEISVGLSSYNIGPNENFQIEIKPPEGASYTVERQAPPSISNYMTLY
ncbi:MAG: archaeal flagellin FlaB [Methanohalophilus sp. T328-1]|jgi:flagellin FlaB|uniref:archaellin/type IV pilin N-terminal domain-containing protein n=1 Tax=Methanohalophilus sp. DAL1 TaxID=1864608 RepID=UPI00079CC957|nr:archaellin/type IV pilin N-terminal domain-containing protein [Methanohalophilus sp. DAL1]KXS46390.1 MAG: archaeal flagellin FlaB [Methanohalophilus sp. T328-1]OBZ35490.1 MAG: flagellin [Methanohalophilus sp. DAL1]